MSRNYDILHTVLKHGSCIEILSNKEYFRKLQTCAKCIFRIYATVGSLGIGTNPPLC